MTQTAPTTPPTAWSRITDVSEIERRIGLSWLSGLGLNRVAPVELLLRLLDLGETDFLFREDLPDDVMDTATVHPTRFVRGATAEIGRLSPAQWERLIAASPEPELRTYAEQRLTHFRSGRGGRGVGLAPHPEATPPSTPDKIAAMAAEVPDGEPRGSTHALRWIVALHEDAEAMRQLARSPKLLVRRSVARAPRLPVDVAELLARDEDRVVRLFLVESCEDAPPDVLLEVAGWWDGNLSFPG